MPSWGPVFKPDRDGDFVLNVRPVPSHHSARSASLVLPADLYDQLPDRGPTFLPQGSGLQRRLTSPPRLRPTSLILEPRAQLELRSPSRDVAYVDGQAVTTVTRSPLHSHSRSVSRNFRQYDTSIRTPVSGASSRSPAFRSPRISAFPRLEPEGFADFPRADPVIIDRTVYVNDPRGTTAPPLNRRNADEIYEDDSASEEEEETPRVTIAETNRRNRREREYRETARRRRDAGYARPERDEPQAPRRQSSRRTTDVRASASTPPVAPLVPRASVSTSSRSARDSAASSTSTSGRRSRQSPRYGDYEREDTYRRTYERETLPSRDRNLSRTAPRSAPPEQTAHLQPQSRESDHSRSSSQRLRSTSSASRHAPTIVQRSRARTDASGFLSPTITHEEPPLMLEDSAADRAKHAVESRIIYGSGGKKTKQYTYA